jgi:hypothetical protein
MTLICPTCDQAGHLALPAAPEWACPQCHQVLQLAHPAPEPTLPACAVCGCHELYRKKDFPHALGLAILTFACVASSITYGLYHWWLTWSILLGSALIDGLLYVLVKDVIVCYRCGAQFRGVPPHTGHQLFELTIFERYRQERLRREQLLAATARGTDGKGD